jgi:ParB family chromosome partitioning protein
MKRKALGKGLTALIPDAPPEAPKPAGEEIQMVKVDAIRPGRFQPRRRIDRRKISLLAVSIRNDGIINPLLVRRVDGGLELVAGERRLEAAREAGLKRVPVMIRDLTDEKAAELALVENIQREELNPVEEAEAYQQLIGQFGLNQDEVAKRVGKERATVANMLRLLKLPDVVQQHLRDGEITMGHGRALLAVPGENEQIRLCRRIIADGLSVRAVEEAAARGGARKKPLQNKEVEKKDPNVRAAEEEMTQSLHAKVQIRGSHQRGRIEIYYTSAGELDRIYQLLTRMRG